MTQGPHAEVRTRVSKATHDPVDHFFIVQCLLNNGGTMSGTIGMCPLPIQMCVSVREAWMS